MSIIFDLERTNQLNPLPDKDLVDLCPPIEPYQVTKSRNCHVFRETHPRKRCVRPKSLSGKRLN
ncbi:Glycogen phosphorylase [Microcystis panniformis FACHB-1757]|uniref:Glycogen phosphorylase n=1 Tax=Microcystis panniformis FACHB-1757 TaxID=1638788 RepID=A0A0K1S5J4_9CHRO|nr:Glycogen phosphorylase [Microcystis panniformis FACHB-1757]